MSSKPQSYEELFSFELSDTDFVALGHTNSSWNVVRTFDILFLLKVNNSPSGAVDIRQDVA